MDNNKDLEYYNEVLEEFDRLRRQTRNRYKEFKSISIGCNDIINMAIDNAVLFINHYKNELENEINRENKKNR